MTVDIKITHLPTLGGCEHYFIEISRTNDTGGQWVVRKCLKCLQVIQERETWTFDYATTGGPTL